MSLKFNRSDIFILIASIILVISSVIGSNYLTGLTNKGDLKVDINISGRIAYTYSLNEDRIITLKKDDHPSLLGDMEIEIRDNKVRVSKEQSPLNYCSKQGFVDKVARPIICLPNEVIVIIRGEISFDWVMPSWIRLIS